jgi:hypothetical protein
MNVILRQDTGIRFCDKTHPKCKMSTIQCLLLLTHQLWHRSKWMPTPNCTCECNIKIWQHFFLCWLKELLPLVVLQEDLATKLCHSRNIETIVGYCCLTLRIILWSTFLHCKIHILCPFLHNPIISGLIHLRLQIITMRHCQKKVVHVLLLVVRFAILNTNNYFVLMAFQMARLTLYVA